MVKQVDHGSQTDFLAKANSVRLARRRLVEELGLMGLQLRAAYAVSSVSAAWLASRTDPPETSDSVFPPSMVWYSLAPLLCSYTAEDFVSLMHDESVYGKLGPELIGHIIASNTSLLGITSVVRALLVGSGSLVKLPSRGDDCWLALFLRQLNDVDPDIARLVAVERWSRHDVDLTQLFAAEVDKIVVYGDNSTLRTIEDMGSSDVLGFGHRVSVGVFLQSADPVAAAKGFAKDILLYDQSGCLSIHTIFIEGGIDEASRFSSILSDELRNSDIPWPKDSSDRAAKVNEQRLLNLMDSEAEVVGQEAFRWTVVLHQDKQLHVSSTHGIVYVTPIEKAGIIETISKVASIIQGVALASGDLDDRDKLRDDLNRLGVPYVCRPGELQQPTLRWREDNRDVLASYLQSNPNPIIFR